MALRNSVYDAMPNSTTRAYRKVIITKTYTPSTDILAHHLAHHSSEIRRHITLYQINHKPGSVTPTHSKGRVETFRRYADAS